VVPFAAEEGHGRATRSRHGRVATRGRDESVVVTDVSQAGRTPAASRPGGAAGEGSPNSGVPNEAEGHGADRSSGQRWLLWRR